jgi:DNA repair protein RadA/Sms
VKNRFGAVSELGVFEMTGVGLKAVPNPSALFLAERPEATPGSAVLCCLEGSRPILVEVQALVSTTSYGMARRMAVGIDQNRLSLLLAVLEKRAGLHLVSDDVFVNMAGGMSVDEPAVDLAIVAAVASSLRNRPVMPGTVVFGEVGLGGEVRGVSQANLRIREAEQMGFTRIVLPYSNAESVASEPLPPVGAGGNPGLPESSGAELISVRTVGEALDMLLA